MLNKNTIYQKDSSPIVPQKAKVIISKKNTAWESILDSEGVLWEYFHEQRLHNDTPVFILPRDTSKNKKVCSALVKQLTAGCSIIEEPGVLSLKEAELFDLIRLPDPNITPLEITKLPRKKTIMVKVYKINNSKIFELPFNLSDLWCKNKIKRLYVKTSETGVLNIWENLPTISKKKLRRIIFLVLKRAFHAIGLPLVSKWYWPFDSRSVFCLRADMEGGQEKSLIRFFNNVQPWKKSLSIFICGQAYEKKKELLKKIAGLSCEIGNHTHTHYVYSSIVRNRPNLELTERILSEVGVTPSGYVGPASFWHASMYDLLHEKGYQYTSSFGVDHDNIPYFPVRNSKENYDLVEIPFHCLGDRFTKFGVRLDSTEVTNFFNRLIEKKYMAAEPMAIYGHPDMKGRLGDHPELVNKICKQALSLPDIWTGNMAELAQWWRTRHAVTAAIMIDSSSGTISGKDFNDETDISWSIYMPDGRWFLEKSSSLKKGLRFDSLTPRTPLSSPKPSDIGEILLTSSNIDLISVCRTWRQSLKRRIKKGRELKAARLRLGF